MAKACLLLGIAAAFLISIIITVPYIIAWRNLDIESREVNFLNVRGINHVSNGEDGSLINVTLISMYPKAAVERKSNIFVIRLVFLLSLRFDVTEFICDEVKVKFRRVDGVDILCIGWETISFQTGKLVNFYRKSDGGNIAPFTANTSINIQPNRWPPFSQDLTNLFYLTDRIETSPLITLNARARTANGELSIITVFFDMSPYTIAIYRFNFPPTIFVIYGCSLVIVAAIAITLLYHRKTKIIAKPQP